MIALLQRGDRVLREGEWDGRKRYDGLQSGFSEMGDRVCEVSFINCDREIISNS